ncbi:pyruvate, phosphate dikinase [Cohaesibacter sp. CAU 1516]|uniref:pyruvate, phosphate dikinase n=1 Tax=Cohaesibacter sp. CAU 1516 TaxID=2576038 RepID=UPI0010FCF419|nr:pyruvate, phosphate dikinase [Cohaesibacter sp. CAU 1516]TLP45549.1 pyruvate, phosphate dikinase [Cohaesibacter sp. CAU 1516]
MGQSTNGPTNGPTKWVYSYGGGQADGRADMRALLGSKGAHLAEMSNLGLPVPPGFTITTALCTHYLATDHSYPDDLGPQIEEALERLAQLSGRRFGCIKQPLFLSIRAGAPETMPGMMEAILNLGLNDETVEVLAKETDNARFAYDSYRRFIQMYGDMVLGIDQNEFEDIVEEVKDERALFYDTELSADDWKGIIERYKALILQELDEPFPQDVRAQLWGAIGAACSSWMSARAITYRRVHDIAEDWGTAVNIQAMVFGNLGESSATAVAHTRDPDTGEKRLTGKYLLNAQGEDVLEGNRTPYELTLDARLANGSPEPSMEELMPEPFARFRAICDQLEHHYRDMLELEFTIEGGQLWILQKRTAKRTSKAALRIAVDMALEGLISKEEAVMRVDPRSLDELLHPTLSESAERIVIAKGLAASPGAASGHLVFETKDAELFTSNGKRVILARTETSPEDVHGMHVAQGIVTARGGMTSHAAVVARGMGIPCVSGAGMIRINYQDETLTVGAEVMHKGDLITLDGRSGEVLKGEVPMEKPELTDEFATLMEWVDGIRRLKVRCNAETVQDAKAARDFGAEGIGLCRTEHMFLQEGRISVMREMIIATDAHDRERALNKLLPMQRADFAALFETMAGFPITVRLLDPPLHEFLPSEPGDIAKVARAVGVAEDVLASRIHALHEFNPMLGHRGCRLAISYPEMVEMQTRALFEAALEAAEKTGNPVQPEIMVPLVSIKEELEFVKARIDATAKKVMKKSGKELSYKIGTMIELPRAALQARKIAESAEFFSFGTNDLTQTTYGISRDDAARYISDYLRAGVVEQDPFISIDVDGVGELMEIAVERGRFARPDLTIGICGEHGGEPASIDFCEKIGLDYVSCSPFRVPIARLAAAQATLRRHQRT